MDEEDATALEDTAFEALEIKRRLTIVEPRDGDEDPDIAYEDELVYDDEDEEDEMYDKYSDEEEEELDEDEEFSHHFEPDETIQQHASKASNKFEEFNRIFKPQEQLSNIQSKTNTIVNVAPTVTTIHSKSPTPAITIATSKSPSPKQQPEKDDIGSPIEVAAQEPSKVEKELRFEDEDPEEYDYEGEYSDEVLGEEEEEEEISDVDDTELMKRLEAKYGKLPKTYEDEPSDNEEEDPTWTSNFLTKLPTPKFYDSTFVQLFCLCK